MQYCSILRFGAYGNFLLEITNHIPHELKSLTRKKKAKTKKERHCRLKESIRKFSRSQHRVGSIWKFRRRRHYYYYFLSHCLLWIHDFVKCWLVPTTQHVFTVGRVSSLYNQCSFKLFVSRIHNYIKWVHNNKTKHSIAMTVEFKTTTDTTKK